MIEIVKIGGNIINDETKLKAFLHDFTLLPSPKILVHGGGREATALSGAMGVETQMINGRRVTDKPTLDIVTMVYAGLINKRIVAMLQGYGCDAMGLTGADGNAIPAKRRSPLPVDFGYVGDIDAAEVNTRLLEQLLAMGITPVFCAICYEPGGTLLNCNADSVASALAVACARVQPVRLTFCFEKKGVLTDVDDDATLIDTIDRKKFEELQHSGALSGGMTPKVSNALDAVDKGVAQVRICQAEHLTGHIGTIIS